MALILTVHGRTGCDLRHAALVSACRFAACACMLARQADLHWLNASAEARQARLAGKQAHQGIKTSQPCTIIMLSVYVETVARLMCGSCISAKSCNRSNRLT